MTTRYHHVDIVPWNWVCDEHRRVGTTSSAPTPRVCVDDRSVGQGDPQISDGRRTIGPIALQIHIKVGSCGGT
jgi:hypothetical protein